MFIALTDRLQSRMTYGWNFCHVGSADPKSKIIAKGLPPLEIPARRMVIVWTGVPGARGLEVRSQESGFRIPNRRRIGIEQSAGFLQ
jgi:hypothetical protein